LAAKTCHAADFDHDLRDESAKPQLYFVTSQPCHLAERRKYSAGLKFKCRDAAESLTSPDHENLMNEFVQFYISIHIRSVYT